MILTFLSHLACRIMLPSAFFFSTNGKRFDTTIKLLLLLASAVVIVISGSQLSLWLLLLAAMFAGGFSAQLFLFLQSKLLQITKVFKTFPGLEQINLFSYFYFLLITESLQVSWNFLGGWCDGSEDWSATENVSGLLHNIWRISFFHK